MKFELDRKDINSRECIVCGKSLGLGDDPEEVDISTNFSRIQSDNWRFCSMECFKKYIKKHITMKDIEDKYEDKHPKNMNVRELVEELNSYRRKDEK